MRKLVVAFAFIEQHGSYLFQFRTGAPETGTVNLIGCFGGKLEPGEEPLTTVCREVSEETTLQVSPHRVEYLGIVEVISDHNLEDVELTAHVFKIMADGQAVAAREGKLVIIPAAAIESRLSEMTPGTRTASKKFILGE